MDSFRALLVTTTFLFASASYAECITPSQPNTTSRGSARISAGQVSCVGRSCYYVPQKIGTDALRRALARAVFGEEANLSLPDDGFINDGRDSTELAFWHKCQETLDEMKQLVSSLDQPVLSTGRERIQLWIKIYHITEEQFNEFSMGLSGIFRGQVNKDGVSRGSVVQDGSTSILNLAFGNLTNHLLNVTLAHGKRSNRLFEIRDVPMQVVEGEIFSRSLTSKTYRDTNFSQPTQEEVGYRVSGVAYVETVGREKRIVLKDFNLNYSMPQPGKENVIAEVLSVPASEILLQKDRPYLLHAENVQASGNSKGRSLPFYLENSRIRSNSKLVIFVSGYPMSEPPAQGQQMLSYSPAEIAALPAANNSDLLGSASFEVSRIGNSAVAFDLVKMQLDPRAMDQKKLRSMVGVKVSAPGLEKTDERFYQAQHLVKNPFQFPASYSNSGNGWQREIRVELRWANKEFGRSQPSTTLRYDLIHYLEMGRIDVGARRAKR